MWRFHRSCVFVPYTRSHLKVEITRERERERERDREMEFERKREREREIEREKIEGGRQKESVCLQEGRRQTEGQVSKAASDHDQYSDLLIPVRPFTTPALP